MSGAVNERSLADRRDRLLRRSAALRTRLGVDLASWQRPLGAVDQVRDALLWLRGHPQWPLAAVAVLAVVRPRRALRWLARGLWAWRLWRRLQPRVQGSTSQGSARRWGAPRR